MLKQFMCLKIIKLTAPQKNCTSDLRLGIWYHVILICALIIYLQSHLLVLFT